MTLFVKGNRKLVSNVAIWNVLAGKKVCGRECQSCYAIKEQARWKNVIKGREYRYERLQSSDFVKDAIQELVKLQPQFVRLHGSGEFSSQLDVCKWVDVSKALPNIVFYTYTKRMKDFDFSELKKLPNFVIHNSVLPDGSYNYGSVEYLEHKMEKFGGFVCPLEDYKTGQCGVDCTWCMEKQNQDTPILFKVH